MHEYRTMFLAWRAQRIITCAGYILAVSGDTPERIARDIRTVQQELPVDLIEFFILTPLPGSADHQALHRDGVWMDPDMNKYDLEHVTTGHAVMTSDEWQAVYRRAWDLYYSAEHIETIFRRAKASGIKPVRLLNHILQFYFTFLQENVHPLQGAISGANSGASVALAGPVTTRSSFIQGGSAKSSPPTTSSSPRSISICIESAAGSSATRAPTPTPRSRRSTAISPAPLPVADQWWALPPDRQTGCRAFAYSSSRRVVSA